MRQLILVAFLALATLAIVPAASAQPLPVPCVASPGVTVLGHQILAPGAVHDGCDGTLGECGNTVGYLHVLSYTERICAP